MIAGLEKHLTQLGWDFVVQTLFSTWEDKHGIFCIKCLDDIFWIIFLLQSFIKAMGH
jgi:hypothetical protein